MSQSSPGAEPAPPPPDQQDGLISVIIPVYNAERYLAEAIASVLAQSYAPIELIVVDDGSTDGSLEVALHWPRVRCVRQIHSGAAAALNHGMRLARGALLAFLDADVLWTAGNLEQQVKTLRANPGLDMVFAHFEQFHSSELDESTKDKLRGAGERLASIGVGTLLIRRQTLLKVGFLSEQLEVAYFAEWYTRAVDAGAKSMLLPSVLLKRRLHTQNLGVRLRGTAKSEYARVLKDSLDRRRRAAAGPA